MIGGRQGGDCSRDGNDAALIARVRRFSTYMCEPGVLHAVRFLYRHRVISRTEWLLWVWAVGSRFERVQPSLPDDELVALIKETFGATELDADSTSAGPCRYPAHDKSYWRGDAGQLICGICHPKAASSRSRGLSNE
jgi:hypothetical protein